jgi:hypothetical protein
MNLVVLPQDNLKIGGLSLQGVFCNMGVFWNIGGLLSVCLTLGWVRLGRSCRGTARYNYTVIYWVRELQLVVNQGA